MTPRPPAVRALTARRTCRQCPVQAECLDYAITNRIDYGIWGATTAKERHRMRPRTVRPDRATRAREVADATAGQISRDRAERARALRAQGSSLAAIAFALDVHERTVARYLSKDAA